MQVNKRITIFLTSKKVQVFLRTIKQSIVITIWRPRNVIPTMGSHTRWSRYGVSVGTGCLNDGYFPYYSSSGNSSFYDNCRRKYIKIVVSITSTAEKYVHPLETSVQ